MPAIVGTNQFLVDKLEHLRTLFNAQNQFAYLYKNDHTPTAGDTTADYTPANYDGATGLPVVWDSAAILAEDGIASITGSQLIYQPSGTSTPNNIYGFYVIQQSPTRLVYAQRFDAVPVVVGADLVPLVFTCSWKEQSIP